MIAAVLLLMLRLSPAARAEIYSAPEDVTVGRPFSYLAATVPAGCAVEASGETLPAGVTVEVKDGAVEGEQDVYLSGVPEDAGAFDCLINISYEQSSNQIVFPLVVLPENPVVTVSPAVTCFLNDVVEISASASVGDGGSLSYQWYQNAALNTTNGTPIDGAQGPACAVDTSRQGTFYYYCVVTNTNSGMTASTTSDIVVVTVTERSLSSVTVETLPAKTLYTVGDRLDTAGLTIRARYSDASSEVLSEGFTVSPELLETAGIQNVQVTYQGLVCIFQVTVEEPQEIIEGFGVLTLPDKRSYEVGDRLDTTGLTIRVYTNLGTRDVGAEELECSPMVFEKAGEQVVTISYGGKTNTFTLTIQEPEKPTRLILGTLPDKTQYTVGETLDTTGLSVLLLTNRNNQQEIRSGYTCAPTLLDTAGTRQITVSYEGFSCTFNVTVSPQPQETPALPTPVIQSPAVQTPWPTAQPVQSPVPLPTAAPTPHIVEHQSHKTGAGNALMAVVIVLALLALVGLGAAVFVMNRGGLEQVSAELEELLEKIKERFKGKH